VAGPTGNTGPQGIQGLVGPQGLKGDPGLAKYTISETPPSGTLGDTWFNSVTGTVFVYYDSFWVEV
jgi:hypothetical protein